MAKIWKWLKRELLEILPVWAFFFFSFGLLALTLYVVLDEYHVAVYQPPEYFVGSLIMAKVVLLADAFLKRGWLHGRPLFFASLWNTGLYLLAAIIVHHLEQVFTLVRQRHLGLVQANHEILRTLGEPRFWAVVAWLIVLIFAFCTLRELIRLIGSERFMEMFFGRRPAPRRGESSSAA